MIMKIKSQILTLIAVVALLCLVGWTSNARSTSRTAWEYKTITAYGFDESPPGSVYQLNELGNHGWELVTVRSEDVVRANKRQIKVDYYLKRPL